LRGNWETERWQGGWTGDETEGEYTFEAITKRFTKLPRGLLNFTKHGGEQELAEKVGHHPEFNLGLGQE